MIDFLTIIVKESSHQEPKTQSSSSFPPHLSTTAPLTTTGSAQPTCTAAEVTFSYQEQTGQGRFLLKMQAGTKEKLAIIWIRNIYLSG